MNSWILGYTFSLLGGALATGLFMHLLRRPLPTPPSSTSSHSEPGTPSWLVGLVERIFFTTVVAFDISSSVIAMVAWLGAKMGANWNRKGSTGETRALAFSALLTGLVSMLFALVGGLICRQQIWWPL